MPHWRLFYHLVWATRDRHPMLADASAVQALEQSLEGSCRDLEIKVHAIGTMPDHVHVACSIPPRLSVSEAVKRLKGASSHHLNLAEFGNNEVVFAWQAEYGVYSFTERVLPEVVAYIQNHEDRHATSNLWSGVEQVESRAPAAGANDSDR